MKWVWLNIKIKIIYEKVLAVKSIHNSKASLKKVWKLQIKFREFNYPTWYSVSFLCYSKRKSFLCYLNLILFLCYLLLCYLVPSRKIATPGVNRTACLKWLQLPWVRKLILHGLNFHFFQTCKKFFFRRIFSNTWSAI